MISEVELEIRHNCMDEHRLLQTGIEAVGFAEGLLDRIPDVVFFVKDPRGRYRLVNQTLVERCGKRSKEDLLGRTAREVFPHPLGDRFLEQDLAVAASGTPVIQNLELHLYPTRREGWCLTDKVPLRMADGKIIGIAGTSRDLQQTGAAGGAYAELAAAVDCVRSRFGRELRVEELAAAAGLSPYQLNRRLRTVFNITAGQLITKTRIDAAADMLRASSTPIADVAHACGYFDQSAFSRVFRRTVGLTPRQYRKRHRS